MTGIAKVMPAAAGVVGELYVEDGDTVVAGQRLLLVKSERRGAQGQGVDASIIERLQAKRDAIAERIELERRGAAEQKRTLTDSLAGLEAEVTTMAETMRTLRERLKVAHEQVEAVRPTVARAIRPRRNCGADRTLNCHCSSQATELYRQMSVKAVEVREKRHALAQLEAKTADNLAVLQASTADAEAAAAEAKGKQGYIVSAPVSGRISSLQAWVGMSTETSMPFISIVPGNTAAGSVAAGAGAGDRVRGEGSGCPCRLRSISVSALRLLQWDHRVGIRYITETKRVNRADGAEGAIVPHHGASGAPDRHCIRHRNFAASGHAVEGQHRVRPPQPDRMAVRSAVQRARPDLNEPGRGVRVMTS